MAFTRFILPIILLLFPFIKAAPQAPTSTPTPICSPQSSLRVVSPTQGSTITQLKTTSLDPTNIEIIYCSGQYFKTRTVDISVWLTRPEHINGGVLLAKGVHPDNKDAQAGFSSYRFNVTIAPWGGSYGTGERVLRFYETTTGFYTAMNFQINSVNVTLATSG
ncbi:hypothetical protein BJ875DRAFT_469040 [Amylocarpus encephaloides]|uniref:Carboxylic ester hydrolase n=1 Tax=Amylocarpus encephaloides TaxID=45428 RepID=A0A9P7YEM3_9HELO|nr:hypothetical protein BJ875DRAFT_469040 [Amylocarpus encephaloides]